MRVICIFGMLLFGVGTALGVIGMTVRPVKSAEIAIVFGLLTWLCAKGASEIRI